MHENWWPFLVGALGFLIAAGVACHAVAYKRSGRSAVAWTLLILLVPLMGVVAYLLFGVNRIERCARRDRSATDCPDETLSAASCSLPELTEPFTPALQSLDRYVTRATGTSLTGGNRVDWLESGENAYPAMLDAIESAGSTISLSTYIFDNDPIGRRFGMALARARERGVEVKVLIDGVGARYSWPPILGQLRELGIDAHAFNTTVLPWRFRYANLRNHRKLLVIDGRHGFTGGMNICESTCKDSAPGPAIADLHVGVEGPIVAHLQQAFVFDWGFATGEWLEGPEWFPALTPVGRVLARGLADGPDDEGDPIRTTILGALATAERTVRLITPYFLPNIALISALNVTAMRGVTVDIVIPAKSNLLLVQWACDAELWQLLERGCRVWKSPPPFDHSKLMVVDEAWTLLGSANWDARSFRLNFEFNLECYDADLGATADRIIQEKMKRAVPVSLADMDRRSFPVRLRDGAARMAAPLL